MKMLSLVLVSFCVFAMQLFGAVSAKNGSLDEKNILHYEVDGKSLKIDTYKNNVILENDGDLIIKKIHHIKAYRKVYTNNKIHEKIFGDKYEVENKDANIKFNGIKYTKKTINNLIEKSLKKEYGKRYVSHKITNYKEPKFKERTEENKDEPEEEYFYEVAFDINLEFKKKRLLTYKQIIDIFTAKGTPSISIDEEFILENNGKYFLCKSLQEKTTIKDNITKQNKSVEKYEVEILKSYSNKDKDSIFDDLNGDKILIVNKTYNMIYSMAIINKNGQLNKYKLSKIENDKLRDYLKYKDAHPILLDGFNFKDQEIRAKYKVNTSNGVKYLSTTFKTVGKKKNVIAVNLKGSSSILNPSSKSNSTLSHDGYLLDAKTYLFEVKKTLKSDNKTKVQWGQKPKKTMLDVKYINSDGKLSSKKWSKGKKQYYDIAGLWYLISWNNKNNIEEKPFLLMIEDFPIEAKYIKKDYGYLVTIKNKNRYKFYLDKFNRITKVSDLANNITMNLTKDDFTTDTIDKNRLELKKLFVNNDLIEVN